MRGLVLEDDTISDFTSQISDNLGSPIASGSSGDVYRCTVESSEGKVEAAVKVFKIDYGKMIEKTCMRILRELRVWLRLNHPTIVPLLGIAYIDPLFPAFVSQWMSSGTLYTYLHKQASISTSARRLLIRDVADGLNYLHSENVVHGDLHPANILIDSLGNLRLTDFGLATVVEDPELQLSTTTLGSDFDSRWRAPEVIAIDHDDSERPTFKSDIYSFGSVTFFIISGDIPWKGKKQSQICIGLSKRVTPARPDNILDDDWNLIRKCWSREPQDRPASAEVLSSLIGPIGFWESFADPFTQESIKVTSTLSEVAYASLDQHFTDFSGSVRSELGTQPFDLLPQHGTFSEGQTSSGSLTPYLSVLSAHRGGVQCTWPGCSSVIRKASFIRHVNETHRRRGGSRACI
ncbi:kinase-like protein [Rhizopogon salebrosus TDB-379]|nr:kinase-like protein [Rhizopogon salebrosus TDB-379]